MIFRELPLSKEMALRGWLCTTDAKVIKLPEEANIVDFCTCELLGCEYEELALFDIEDEDNFYKNDFRSILIDLKDDSSSYEFFIVDSNGNETPLIDNKYGQLFNKGFNTKQPLKVGYRIDWVRVFEFLGVGKYRIRVNQTDFNNTISQDSHIFNVQEFNEIRSNNTVKIETTQKGKVLNGVNYSGMEWVNMVRVSGTFRSESPNYEIEDTNDADYKDVHIQIEKFNEYILETELLPSSIGDLFTDGVAFTDKIDISTNDLFNYKQYRRLPVVFTGELEIGLDYSRNNKKRFSITFKDLQRKVKRNFYV